MAEQKFSSSQGYMIGGPGLTIHFLTFIRQEEVKEGKNIWEEADVGSGWCCRYLFHYIAN